MDCHAQMIVGSAQMSMFIDERWHRISRFAASLAIEGLWLVIAQADRCA
ncbi:hypothetical protein [Burkholderia stagnalis]|nr:hypothetical protein [Burkholderia stagnalis]